MNNPKCEVYADMLAICKDETLRVAATVPEAARFKQLKEGKAHPAWLLGHLANSANSVALMWTLGQESRIPREYVRKFAPDFAKGDPISPDPANYPAWDDIVALYSGVMTQLVTSVRALDDDLLPQPLDKELPEPMKSYFATVGLALTRMVGHDNYHRGQMALLAKLNG